MQDETKKKYFIEKVGHLIRKIRTSKLKTSINQIANAYDIDKSNWSKIERGFYSIEFTTLWTIIEALDIPPADFMQMLKEELGEDFKLMDE